MSAEIIMNYDFCGHPEAMYMTFQRQIQILFFGILFPAG